MEKKRHVVFMAALCATAVFGAEAGARAPMVPQPREWKPSADADSAK